MNDPKGIKKIPQYLAPSTSMRGTFLYDFAGINMDII